MPGRTGISRHARGRSPRGRRWALLFLLLGGCAATQPPAPASEPAAARAPLRIAVVGASQSAGLGSGLSLAELLEAALEGRAEISTVANAFLFLNPGRLAARQVEELAGQEWSLVIGLDFLVWFGYGRKSLEQRRRDLDAALALLGELDGVLVVGTLPDLRGASPFLLPAAAIPLPRELAELNERIRAWARDAPRRRVLPLADWLQSVRRGDAVRIAGRPRRFPVREVILPDGMHPTRRGQALLALLTLEALEGPGGVLAGRPRVRDLESLEERVAARAAGGRSESGRRAAPGAAQGFATAKE